MGGWPSYPVLPTSQQYFVLVGQNIREIPYTIPPGHPVISLNLQNNLIRQLPVGLLQLHTLILNDNSLDDINEEMRQALLSYTSLKNLELAQNQLTTFDISIPSLEILNIIQNRLSSVPTFSNSIQKASFDFNFIKILDKSSSTIKNLSISLNCIEKVDDSLKMEHLETLDLSMNRISVLENFAEKFPVIRTLDISMNLMKKFPFPLSPSIVELNLSGNKIESFSEDIKHLENLEKLNISLNKLTEIPELPKSLKQLFANNNLIQKVADSELPSLEYVTFSCNQLECLPKFANHSSQSLLFSHNRVKNISLEMMVKTVEQLNLSQNEITEIPGELFSLPRLRILNLDSNKIEEIPESIVDSNISSLSISQNPIKILPKLPKSLDSLFACYCEIEDISEIFTNCVRISKICLSGNKIKKFPSDENDTFSCLRILALSQCDLDHFPSEFLIRGETPSKVSILDLSFNAITFFPVRFSAPYLIDLDLSQNQIGAIPDFSKFPQLVALKIANNPISCHMSFMKNEVLDSIDVTNIGEAEINVPLKVREVLTTVTSLSSPFRHMRPIESGYAQCVGSKSSNEDSIAVRDDLDFYLVCDGHNGSLTATTVANILPSLFQSKHEFAEGFVEEAIAHVNEKLMSELNVSDGASIVCAEISRDGKEIITANLGDSRAMIVVANGEAKMLSKPHLPTSRREFERIAKRGGRVVQKKTNGSLPLSRAIGDFEVDGVSNDPEILRTKIEKNDKFLVLACSAVFESLAKEEIAEIVANCDSAWDAAYIIKNVTFERRPSENISVIVVPLTF